MNFKKWYRLDTAALIFPAVARKNWRNAFRVSASLNEPVDPDVLQRAAADLRPRFPSFFVTLQRGAFWYYLEESAEKVRVKPDYAYPLTLMSSKELRQNCMRILYHENRIAVEYFHVLADGRGGMIFLSNLLARYLELKYGIEIPKGDIIRDCKEPPRPEELEDSFLKYTADVAAVQKEPHSYRLHGEPEPDGFLNLITGIADTKQLLSTAHRYKVSLTSFLSAVMAKCILEMQDLETPRKKQKPVKVTVPVDLRQLFESNTLRNFVLVLNLGVDPRFGDYTLEELCKIIHHQLGAGATRQNMAGMIAANVLPQKVAPIRLAPVFLKNFIMNQVYESRGEKCGCINISNLNQLRLPDEMKTYINRMEFIVGPQRSYPNNCCVFSYNGKTYINMIRTIRETELERRFFSRLVELGVPIDIESNRSD